jgi:hypothetical protein
VNQILQISLAIGAVHVIVSEELVAGTLMMRVLVQTKQVALGGNVKIKDVGPKPIHPIVQPVWIGTEIIALGILQGVFAKNKAVTIHLVTLIKQLVMQQQGFLANGNGVHVKKKVVGVLILQMKLLV